LLNVIKLIGIISSSDKIWKFSENILINKNS